MYNNNPVSKLNGNVTLVLNASYIPLAVCSSKLKRYVKYNSLDVVLNRKNLLVRDNFSCQYCLSKSHLTVDHILPKEKGGSDTWENLIIACSPCNSKKGNKTPKEANMRLMKQARKPNKFIYFKQFVKEKNIDWENYIFSRKN